MSAAAAGRGVGVGAVSVEAGSSAVPARCVAEAAQGDDSPGIAELLAEWAKQGLTLARRPAEIRSNIEDFVVVRDPADARVGGRLLACGALEVVLPGLAEIRSVAVRASAKGTGAGTLAVNFLLAMSREHALEQLVLLTKVPEFFARFGFTVTPHDELPESFRQKVILARGRTLLGRTAMSRAALPPLVADGLGGGAGRGEG